MRFAPVLPLLLALPACARVVDTLPPRTTPNAAVVESTLYVPAGLEIRNVDYVASLYSNVGGGGVSAGIGMPNVTSVGGRAFIKVFAVDRRTGEQVLLLYENVSERPRPIQIIRFRAEGAVAERP